MPSDAITVVDIAVVGDAGYSLHLANTTAIKQYDGLKHRGDESDARHLAHKHCWTEPPLPVVVMGL